MSVPGVLGLYSLELLPYSMIIAFVYISFVNGSGTNFLQLVMVSPVSGWMAEFSKWSMMVGLHLSDMVTLLVVVVEIMTYLMLSKID